MTITSVSTALEAENYGLRRIPMVFPLCKDSKPSGHVSFGHEGVAADARAQRARDGFV